MATDQSVVDTILANLPDIEVRARKMFGEYGIYCDDKVVAFVCDNILYVKILPENADLASGLDTGPCYPGSKPYYIVPSSRIADDWLQELIQITADAVPTKKKK